ADETLLHRLFAHLFRTLFSYGKASGVDVGVTDDGFFVEDDGSGVPHAEREYADAQTMTDAKSGAGIRVAERLASRHGWELSIEANDDGGTRFLVSGADVRDK
ncbi:MAG: ATP-binding protein, partial [Haloarculaceae archaeon]